MFLEWQYHQFFNKYRKQQMEKKSIRKLHFLESLYKEA